MPRTKRVTKKNYSDASTRSKGSSDGSFLISSEKNTSMIIADINRQFDAQITKLDKELGSSVQSLTRSYDMFLCKLPQAVLDKPPRDILIQKFNEEDSDSEEVSSTVNSKVTESLLKNRPKRFTRSSSQDDNCDGRNMMPPPPPSRFRTPMCNVANSGKYNLITPKIQPNSVLSILRRPREGEMAVSMSGSPLLVSSVTHDNMANINVPLPNGSVMSILPQTGLRPHDIPNMDDETMEQLKRLKENLTSFLRDK